MLCTKVDFIIFVISLFKVDRELVNLTINNIKLAEGNILGAVTVGSRDSDSFGYNYNNNLYGYYNSYLNGTHSKIQKNKKFFFNNFFKWFDS